MYNQSSITLRLIIEEEHLHHDQHHHHHDQHHPDRPDQAVVECDPGRPLGPGRKGRQGGVRGGQGGQGGQGTWWTGNRDVKLAAASLHRNILLSSGQNSINF